MKNRIRKSEIYTILLCSLTTLCSCLTAPVLQSSRIHSKRMLGASVDIQFHSLEPSHLDSITGSGLNNPILHPLNGLTIGKRVELSGFIIPLILDNKWDCNLKVGIIDIGYRKYPFRNIGFSAFISSNGNISIAGSLFWANVGGGLLFGTSMMAGEDNEIEFVFSPAGQYNYYCESNGEADTTVDIEIEQKELSLGFGIFWYPWFDKIGLEIGVGGRYNHTFERTITGEYSYALKLSPFLFQLTLRKHFRIFKESN